MSRLVAAIQLAARAHAGQPDKTGQPFIGHPLRVMARGRDESEMVVGVLHDVLEDCPGYNFFRLEQYVALGNGELNALDAITRRNGRWNWKNNGVDETYKAYIGRVAKNELAREVKRNDILDNADPARAWAQAPLSRYRWAWTYLFPDEPLPRELEKSSGGTTA